MAKRLIRIEAASLSDHTGSCLSFILTNHSVVLASPLRIESEVIKVKNTKGHVLHLRLDQIEEIWSDVKVP